MNDQEEYRLVVKALTDGLSNCVLWKNAEVQLQVARDLNGLRASYVKSELLRCVKNGTARLTQKPETRDGHRDHYQFVYFAIIPVEGFTHGVFVELVLDDPDPEVPVVVLVNAHPPIP